MQKVAKADWNPPGAPDDLSSEAKELFDFYVGQRIQVRNPAQVAAFVEGLRAMDRANEARVILKKDGLLGKSKRSGLSRRHPAVDILENAEAHFRKIWRRLELFKNSERDGFTFVDIV
jgi:phage terminase small subunit